MTLTQLDYYVRIGNQKKYWYITDKTTNEPEIYINHCGENVNRRKAQKFNTEFQAKEQIILNGWEKWASVRYE